MTAKALWCALVLVVAAAWSGTAYAADYGRSTAEVDRGRHTEYSSFGYGTPMPAESDGTWSGRWVSGEWTPGYWHNGVWRAAEIDDGGWVALVNENGRWVEHTISSADWNMISDEGRVMGYSSRMHSPGMHVQGHAKAGSRCYVRGAVRGYRGGHGHGWGCGHHCGCGHHRDGWYDCWNVWQPDDYNNFAAIRESDYDPVMGNGDYGRSFFGWGGW